MERTMLLEKNHPGSHSKLVSKVESSIRIDSITIDLDNVDEKVEAEKCSHFSMRGYVSEIRKRDWKICWPFASDGDSNNYEEQGCLLPPLHVPKFRFWRCQNCVWEVDAKGTANCYGSTALKSCSTGFKSTKVCSHAPILGDDAMLPSDVQGAANQEIPEGRQADAFASLTNASKSHHSLSIDNERKTKDENVSNIGKSVGSEDNLKQENHRLACVATEVVSSPIQKTDLTDKIAAFKSKCINLCEPGCGHHEVVAAEFARNLNCMVNNATEICEAGKETSIDDQYKEIITRGASGEAGNIDDGALTADKDPVSRPSLELDEYDDPSSESTDIMVGNNSQDDHHENSSGLHRRKTRKVRLLTELLCENGDGDTDNHSQYSLPHAFPDASAGVDKVPVLQGEVAIQGKARRGLGQNRKRKLPQDEDSRSPEMRSTSKVCKEVRNSKRDGETAELSGGSESEEDAFGRMGLQTGMKSQWAKNKVDRSLVVSKKKNKKALSFDECLFAELSPEKAPIEIGEKISPEKATAVDDVLTKSAPNAFTGREMDFFPLHSSQMEKNVNDYKKKGKMPLFEDYKVSPTPWNHGILREGPVIRKDVGTIHTGLVPVPFHSAEDTYLEKGLDLSLNSYKTAQSYDGKHIPPVENRQSSLFTWQEGSSKNQAMRKAAEIEHVGNFNFTSKIAQDAPFEKGMHSNPSTKRPSFKIPFLSEKQKYNFQVEIGGCSLMQKKDFCNTKSNTKSNEKTIGMQEHSAFPRKDINQRADKVSEQGALDDIPMEIVELMAKNQYERCLPDGEYEKRQLETISSSRRSQMMNFSQVYGLGGLSLFHQETTQKQNPPARRNGIIKIGEIEESTKQKAVDFFSQADRNSFNTRQLEKTGSPVGFGPFLQHQEKPSSRVQHSACISNVQNISQNCKQIGDVVGNRSCYANFHTPGPCNTCQSIPQQSKEANHLWSSMMSNHMPFVYSIPPKCVTQSTNVNVFPHSSGSILKENMNGDRELKFLNKNAANLGKQNRNFGSETLIRAGSERPFAGKHNGIELNQKPIGSLDLYSNETIPAMHLLSLMDAGVQSSAPINMDVNSKFLKRPSITHNPEPKEFSRLDTRAFKAVNTVKHSPPNHHGKNQLAENFRDHIPVIQTTAGASSSSILHDKGIRKATDFPIPVIQDKEKRKGYDSRTRNKVNRSQKSAYGGFGTNCGSIPAHNMQTMFFGASDSSMFPLPFRALEKPNKHKLESPANNRTVHAHKSSSETEVCSVNRNPADFTVPEAGNMYMIAGEDLKFEKEVPFVNGSRSLKLDGPKRQRKLPAVKGRGRPPMSRLS